MKILLDFNHIQSELYNDVLPYWYILNVIVHFILQIERTTISIKLPKEKIYMWYVCESVRFKKKDNSIFVSPTKYLGVPRAYLSNVTVKN